MEERVCGRRRARRTELGEEPVDGRLALGERHGRRPRLSDPSEQEEEKQRLVRRAFTAAPPHPHPEQAEEIRLLPPARRFRMALEELGPTFVKFGQILSSRRDFVTEPVYNELRKLQDQVAPFPGAQAKEILEKELGRPLDQVFTEFEELPVASASLAQVHRATLHSGEKVAVKIQRPGIHPVIEVDVAILLDVARFLERHVEELTVLNPLGVVREFAKTLSDELDFTNEAQNMERFAKQFRGNRNIKVPHVHHELTTERALTMEFVAGSHVNDIPELRRHDVDPVRLAERMSKLIFQQMFQFGFFHGDPHPGNMSILPGGVTVLYDYGMMGNLTRPFREDIAAMILGLVEKDSRMVMRSLLGMSEQGFADDPRKLESDVQVFATRYLDKPLKELHLGFVLNRLLDLLMEHKLRMKADFYLGIKALSRVANVEKVDAGPKGVVLAFRDNQFNNPEGLIGFIREQGASAKIRNDKSGQKLVLLEDWDTPEERLKGTAKILRRLARIAGQAKAA